MKTSCPSEPNMWLLAGDFFFFFLILSFESKSLSPVWLLQPHGL